MKPVPTPRSYLNFRHLADALRAHGINCPMIFTSSGQEEFEVRFVGCVAESNPRHENDNAPEAA